MQDRSHPEHYSPAKTAEAPSKLHHTGTKRKNMVATEGVSDSVEFPPPAKRPDTYSTAAKKIMASMGYVPGTGLGRSGTGIVDPIQESAQKGRRGFGFQHSARTPAEWEKYEISCEPKPEWIEPCQQPTPSSEELNTWLRIGERKETIDDETTFCDPSVLNDILQSKSSFDALNTKDFLGARLRSNPFETIKGAIFQNRAAMKMANIDAVFDFMFTKPRKPDESLLLGSLDILYFADICAGPGGFSEYVLWKTKWHSKGFGFTLKDPSSGSDFNLDAFHAAPCETFEPHYGEGGEKGDGDVTKPENLSEFRNYVLEQTDGHGVHFVMADGGISVEGEENIQELLTKQLVLCQYLCALSILREGGHFVCKVFDQFTLFSVGLLYLLYRCFERVCIFKPVTSRPANSERYIVCRGLRQDTEDVHNYLFRVNRKMCDYPRSSPEDVLQVVPLDVILDDEDFSTYVRAFNDSFGKRQFLSLQNIHYFVENSKLQDTRQADIKCECLRLWNVPNKTRPTPSVENAGTVFQDSWKKLGGTAVEPEVVNSDHLKNLTEGLEFLNDKHSWKWYLTSGKRYMMVGLGRHQIHSWDMTNKSVSFKLHKGLYGTELPKGTVIEVEIDTELEGEGTGQRKKDTVYIVDIISVSDEFFGDKPQKERLAIASKLCKVVNKPCRRSALLKVKEFHRANDLQTVLQKLSLKARKGISFEVPTYPLGCDEKFIAPSGVIFFKTVKDPWQLHLNRRGEFYFFNRKTGESSPGPPASSVASYIATVQSRHKWGWKRSIFSGLCGHASADSKEAVVKPEDLYQYLMNVK